MKKEKIYILRPRLTAGTSENTPPTHRNTPQGSERHTVNSVVVRGTALALPPPSCPRSTPPSQNSTELLPKKETHLLGGDVVPLSKGGLFLVGGHRVVPVLVKPRSDQSHETRKVCGGAWENHDDDLLNRHKSVLYGYMQPC